MRFNRSRSLMSRAQRTLVGGVNSPVRAFKAVGGGTVFIKRASGSHIVDEDGNAFVDYVMSWGALILGHARAQVVRAVRSAASSGMSFGASTEKEVILAETIRAAVPSMQKIRLVNSGTEAVMSAIRLARGFTGRDKIIKFDGCYHGHSDSLLVRAGSGALTFGVADSRGVCRSVSRDTIVLPYNDSARLAQVLEKQHAKVAAIIVEPVAANMGVVLPNVPFLLQLRALSARYGIVLIFDEVITGFRFTYGSLGGLLGIEPDLTCLGKIIGAGMPLAAYGGRSKIMDHLSPLGPVYQAGTLSGNPVAVSSGIAALRALKKADYIGLNQRTEDLCLAMQELLAKKKIKSFVSRAGSLFTVFFTDRQVTDLDSAKTSDTRRFARFFRAMLSGNVMMAPSQFEANFVSFAHTQSDFEKTMRAFSRALEAR